MDHEDSATPIKLAARVVLQIRCGGGQPIIPSEVGRLRFLAESADEFEMPLDRLGEAVIERECRRMGMRSLTRGIWPMGNN